MKKILTKLKGGYLGLNRTINAAANPAFPGLYSNHGFTIGLGVRR